MQKLSLTQSLSQKLSPQQIQFIKLLQIPTAELDARVEEELEVNPALEEGAEERDDMSDVDDDFSDSAETSEEIDVDDYLRDDDFSGYKMQGDGGDGEDRDMPIAMQSSLNEALMQQLGYLRLDDRQQSIGRQLIGSIEEDGYIRREMEAIINDLAFSQNIETDLDEIEEVLRKIQNFDPAGIAARSLQECLLLQLERKVDTEEVVLAIQIVDNSFEEFTKKHYDKVMRRVGIQDEDLLRSAISVITKLNPKPGGGGPMSVRSTSCLILS